MKTTTRITSLLLILFLIIGCSGGGGGSTSNTESTPPPATPNPEPVPPPVTPPPTIPPPPEIPASNYIHSQWYTDPGCYWSLQTDGNEFNCFVEIHEKDSLYQEDSLIIIMLGKDENTDFDTVTTSIYSNGKLFSGPLVLENNLYDLRISYSAIEDKPTGDFNIQVYIDRTLLPDGIMDIEIVTHHKDGKQEVTRIQVNKLAGKRPQTDFQGPYIEGNWEMEFNPRIVILSRGEHDTTATIMFHDQDRSMDLWSSNVIGKMHLSPTTKDGTFVEDIDIEFLGSDYEFGGPDASSYKKSITIDDKARIGLWYIDRLTLYDKYSNKTDYTFSPSFFDKPCLVIN